MIYNKIQVYINVEKTKIMYENETCVLVCTILLLLLYLNIKIY